DPQELRDFFLDLDDGLGLLGPRLHPCDFPLELGDASVTPVAGPASPLLGFELQKAASIALPSPTKQMRLIDSFSTTDRPDLARLRAPVDLLKDPPLVLRRVTATLWLLAHVDRRLDNRCHRLQILGRPLP